MISINGGNKKKTKAISKEAVNFQVFNFFSFATMNFKIVFVCNLQKQLLFQSFNEDLKLKFA